VREEICRRLADDVLELPDEVRLIGQATGDGRPATTTGCSVFLRGSFETVPSAQIASG
jgi:hypothetical protein